MSRIVQKLSNEGLLQPHPFLLGGVLLEVCMGSRAFGVASELSDWDVYGIYLPSTFGTRAGDELELQSVHSHSMSEFETFKKIGVTAFDETTGRTHEYDFKIDPVAKFFQRCMNNNANALEMLFTSDDNVLFMTAAAKLVRDHRHLFLHKGESYKSERSNDRSIIGGFAYVQMDDLRHQRLQDGKRAESIARYGYDVKAAYHVVRLMDEAEQLLTTSDLDLQRNKETLKAIRAGGWSLQQLVQYFDQKEEELEELHASSSLPQKPDAEAIEQLFRDCLALSFFPQ